MPNVISNGIRTFYEVYGEGEPLVLVHGLGSSHEDWELMVPALKEHFQVILYDVRGHGNTERTKGPYSIPLFANDLAKFLKAINIESAHIGGISMGGMIAFQFAVDYPEFLKKLIIINAVPDVKLKTLEEKVQLYTRKILTKAVGMYRMADLLIFNLFPWPNQKKLRARFLERFKRNDEAPYDASLNAIVGWGIGDKIKDIEAPTIVISAEKDYLPLETKEKYVNKMQNASFVVIKNSRHASTQDQPEKLSQLIIDFCETKDKSSSHRVVLPIDQTKEH